jgi:hypothetical protein
MKLKASQYLAGIYHLIFRQPMLIGLKNLIIVISFFSMITTMIMFLSSIVTFQGFHIIIPLVITTIVAIIFMKFTKIIFFACGVEIKFYERDGWETKTKVEQNISMRDNPETAPLSVYIFGTIWLFLEFCVTFFLIAFVYYNLSIFSVLTLLPIFIGFKRSAHSFYKHILFNKKGLDKI